MRKVFLDELPKCSGGKGNYGDIGSIDWKKSIGYKVRFVYDDIEGYFEIISYDKNYVRILYKDEPIFKIYTGSLSQGNLGKLLGKYTNKFKIEVDTIFKDDKRNFTIINREIRSKIVENEWKDNEKWYNYHCNKCTYEGWIEESRLLKGQGCSCCCSRPKCVVEGINDIPTTAPWMIPYFQGGYDEAKLYTKCSNKKIIPICPDCRRIKDKAIPISRIYKKHSIGCYCGDGLKYPEKFFIEFLYQLNIEFKTQLSKTDFKWCLGYRYDFYFKHNNDKYLIEVNGIQHYEESPRGRSLQKEQENDKNKKELAMQNGIKDENYIIIDCRKSEIEFIKNNILHSRIAELFDLSNINWLKCHEFACSNLIKLASKYKKDNTSLTCNDIASIMKMSNSTIIKYLKKGNELGWCEYNAKEEMIKSNIVQGFKNGKEVEMFKENISIGIFPSCSELSRQSEKLLRTKLSESSISMACMGKREYYKGYTFKYTKLYNN